MFGSPKCPDIIYVVFFAIEFLRRFVWLSLNFQFCLPCGGYPKSDLMSAGNEKKTILGRQKKTNGCMEKGWKFLWDWIRIYILPGFMSLGNTAQPGWFQKMSFISPLPKKKVFRANPVFLFVCFVVWICWKIVQCNECNQNPAFRKKMSMAWKK